MRGATPSVLQCLDIPPDLLKVFLKIGTLHPRSEWITVDVSCVCDLQWIGLLVLVFQKYGLVKHRTMWNIPHL